MKTNNISKEYWSTFPYYKIEDVNLSYTLELETDLAEKLKSLSVGERLHFFDFATTYSYRKYWNGDSTYKTRRFGINQVESFQKIINLGIFEVVSDIESILEITSKGELKEKAEQFGFDIKKSWTLEKIFNNVKKHEKGLEFLNGFLKEKLILNFLPKYKSDLIKILDYQVKIKIITDLISMV